MASWVARASAVTESAVASFERSRVGLRYLRGTTSNGRVAGSERRTAPFQGPFVSSGGRVRTCDLRIMSRLDGTWVPRSRLSIEPSRRLSYVAFAQLGTTRGTSCRDSSVQAGVDFRVA